MISSGAFKDKETGYIIHSIGCMDKNITNLYFTAMSWLYDSRNLIVAEVNETGAASCRYHMIDTDTCECTTVSENAKWGSGTVSSDYRFYFNENNEIICFDLISQRRFQVCSNKDGASFYGPLSISNDGKVLGVLWNTNSEWHVGKIDTTTGEIENVYEPRFVEPYNQVSHVMINPVYKNLIVYCHEGKTQHIPDRIWVVNADTGRSENVYKQKLTNDGLQGECVGHEMWSYDGERLYFVKYMVSVLKPTGLYYVDKTGSNWGLINSSYYHWHVSVSPDGSWLVSDTKPQDGISKIVLTNVQTGKAEVLCGIKCRDSHPGHPHPSFSPDSKKVCFTFEGEDRFLKAGYIQL